MGIQERKEREKEVRKNRIIRTARKEFIKFGMRDSCMKNIARKAEVALRTVYSYFNNKQELYIAVLLSGLKLLYKEIEKIASEEDPIKAIEMVKEAYASFYKAHGDHFQIMMFLGFHRVYKDAGDESCRAISDIVLNCVKLVSGIIEKGMKQGLLNGNDPWKLSWALWSLFMGVGHLNEARRSLNVKKDDFETLFDFAFTGLLKA